MVFTPQFFCLYLSCILGGARFSFTSSFSLLLGVAFVYFLLLMMDLTWKSSEVCRQRLRLLLVLKVVKTRIALILLIEGTSNRWVLPFVEQ